MRLRRTITVPSNPAVNCLDVEALAEIDKRLPEWNWQARDHALFELDQRINRRGTCIDTDLAQACVDLAEKTAAMIGRCLQIASGVLYTEDGFEELHREKIEALQSIIEEASGAPVLVAYHFKHEAERILKSIKGACILDQDPQTIRDWNAGKIRVLLTHPVSCSHGLNLQDGGNILVFFSRSWNLEAHQQIIERIGPTRQAQADHPRPVYIYTTQSPRDLRPNNASRTFSWNASTKRIKKGLNYVEQQLFRTSETSLCHARHELSYLLPFRQGKEG